MSKMRDFAVGAGLGYVVKGAALLGLAAERAPALTPDLKVAAGTGVTALGAYVGFKGVQATRENPQARSAVTAGFFTAAVFIIGAKIIPAVLPETSHEAPQEPQKIEQPQQQGTPKNIKDPEEVLEVALA